MRRRFWGVGLVGLTACVLTVLGSPGVALAATTLTDGRWVVPIGVQPASADYSATTSRPYWSVVFFSPGYIHTSDPNTTVDYGMRVLDSAQNQLAATTFGPYEPDYVAIDGNVRAAQRYTARVVRNQSNYDGEQYRMVYLDGRTILSAGQTIIPAATSEPNNVYVRDVYLRAGTTATFFAGGYNVPCPTGGIGTLYLHAFLLGSDPARPSSAVQSRNSALVSSASVAQTPLGCGVTLRYTVARSAWYGLLIFDPHYPQVVVTLTTS